MCVCMRARVCVCACARMLAPINSRKIAMSIILCCIISIYTAALEQTTSLGAKKFHQNMDQTSNSKINVRGQFSLGYKFTTMKEANMFLRHCI